MWSPCAAGVVQYQHSLAPTLSPSQHRDLLLCMHGPPTFSMCLVVLGQEPGARHHQSVSTWNLCPPTPYISRLGCFQKADCVDLTNQYYPLAECLITQLCIVYFKHAFKYGGLDLQVGMDQVGTRLFLLPPSCSLGTALNPGDKSNQRETGLERGVGLGP